MTRASRLAYAQARLQARYGALPDAALWQRLEGSASLPHFLQQARKTVIRPWVLEIGPHSDAHGVARALRQRLRDEVTAVARWLPPPWHGAVDWTRRLVDLPALQTLFAGEPIPAWVYHDPALSGFASEVPQIRLQALETSELGPLLADWREGVPLLEAWRRHWRRLWPRLPDAQARALAAVERRLLGHRQALAGGEPGDGARARARLVDDLARLFRRYPAQPAAAFLYLTVFALQLARLRTALATRLLFPPEEAPAA